MIKFKNTFFAEIQDGELKIENFADWAARLCKLEGEKVMIKIEKRRKLRSLDQNSYFHGVILPILADELGYTAQEVKGVLKWHFKIPHTSELSTVEFEDFCKRVREWASADLSIYLPSPNENLPFLI
jgi:hypothetical protein